MVRTRSPVFGRSPFSARGDGLATRSRNLRRWRGFPRAGRRCRFRRGGALDTVGWAVGSHRGGGGEGAGRVRIEGDDGARDGDRRSPAVAGRASRVAPGRQRDPEAQAAGVRTLGRPHGHPCAGRNFSDRLRIHRNARSWVRRYRAMPEGERLAVEAKCGRAGTDVSAREVRGRAGPDRRAAQGRQGARARRGRCRNPCPVHPAQPPDRRPAGEDHAQDEPELRSAAVKDGRSSTEAGPAALSASTMRQMRVRHRPGSGFPAGAMQRPVAVHPARDGRGDGRQPVVVGPCSRPPSG